MKNHIIITYKDPTENDNHVDPDFTKLLYGDSNYVSLIRDNLEEGSYVFFNTKIGNDRYITAYFCVEKVLFRGENDTEIDGLNFCGVQIDKAFIVGSRIHSKIFNTPLLFNKQLAIELTSLNMPSSYFTEGYFKDKSVLSAISSKTRNPVVLSNRDKDILLDKCKYKG